MRMNNKTLKNIIDYCNIGFARCKLIFDNKGNPSDFVFSEANELFVEIIGFGDKLTEGMHASDLIKSSKTLYNPEAVFRNVLKSVKNKKGNTFDIFFRDQKLAYQIDLIIEEEDEFIIILNRKNVMDKLLFDSDDFFEIIVKNMKDLIFVVDLDFRLSYISPSVQTILGFTEAELIGQHLKDILRAESVETIYGAYRAALKNPASSSGVIELNQTTKEKVPIQMEYIVNYMRDSNDEIVGMMGIGRDITEWVKAKKEISMSRERLILILNSTADGIFGVNKEGLITFSNKACVQMCGYNHYHDLYRKPVGTIFGIDNEEEVFLERFSDIFEKGIGRYGEVDQFVRKDGSSFYAEYHIYPQLASGEVVGVVISFFDITETIKTRNELYEAERSKSVLLANLPGLAYRCDFDRDWTFRFVSEGCYALTGYYPESFINNRDLSFNDIILPEYQEELYAKWESLIGTNEIAKLEYEIVCADGSTKWVFEQGQIIYGEDGEIVALEGIIVDISDQKQRQAEIEYLSYHDSLTGLLNRSSLEKTKENLFQEKYLPISYIVGDINGLKLINDTLGHSEGDKILVLTAKLIKEVVGDEYYVFRTSGDEFSVLMPNTSAEKAMKIQNKILDHIDKYNNSSDNLFKINIALGSSTMFSLNQTFKDISRIVENYMYIRKLNEKLSYHSSLILHMKSTLYEKSQITEEHAERLKRYSRLMGERLGLNRVQLDELALVSTLHDIGKIGVDDRILKKTSSLTKEEWIEMKRHPEIGYRICMASPELVGIAPYILCHHERWDGKGYPAGLKEEEIPLLARIIAVADAFDAMTEDRPYRVALTREKAIQEIKDNAGTQFDPKIAKLFIDIIENEDKNH